MPGGEWRGEADWVTGLLADVCGVPAVLRPGTDAASAWVFSRTLETRACVMVGGLVASASPDGKGKRQRDSHLRHSHVGLRFEQGRFEDPVEAITLVLQPNTQK